MGLKDWWEMSKGDFQFIFNHLNSFGNMVFTLGLIGICISVAIQFWNTNIWIRTCGIIAGIGGFVALITPGKK